MNRLNGIEKGIECDRKGIVGLYPDRSHILLTLIKSIVFNFNLNVYLFKQTLLYCSQLKLLQNFVYTLHYLYDFGTIFT